MLVDQSSQYLIKMLKTIEILSEGGDPSAVLAVTERLQTDLIAVVCRDPKGIRGITVRVSRNILAHSRCSVLIGKTRKD